MLVTYLISNNFDFTQSYTCDVCGTYVNCLHSLSFSRRTVQINGEYNEINYGVHKKGHKLCLKSQIPILLESKTVKNENSEKFQGITLDIMTLNIKWLAETLHQTEEVVNDWMDDGWIPAIHHKSVINALRA